MILHESTDSAEIFFFFDKLILNIKHDSAQRDRMKKSTIYQ